MTTQMPELKPCPFCGGHAYSDEVDGKSLFWVECRECSVDGRICPTQASAVTAWNTRAAIEASQVPAGLIDYLRSRAAAGELGYTTLSEWADQLASIEAATSAKPPMFMGEPVTHHVSVLQELSIALITCSPSRHRAIECAIAAIASQKGAS